MQIKIMAHQVLWKLGHSEVYTELRNRMAPEKKTDFSVRTKKSSNSRFIFVYTRSFISSGVLTNFGNWLSGGRGGMANFELLTV